MAYQYRSPLQDDDYYDYDDFNWNGRGFNRFFPPRPPPPRFRPMLPPGPPRIGGPMRDPYFRPPPPPGPAPTFSRRFEMSSYPKELNDMFGALECRLCAVEVTSPIGAKMHYGGRPHMRKVKSYLLDWCQRTGNPLPNLEDFSQPPSQTTLAGYCELCDVRLISINDKMLHYSGKAHKRNERDPTKAKKKNKAYETIDLSATDARFGIGLDFSMDPNEVIVKQEDVKVIDFVCELCDVKAVSQDQLNVHLSGKKHQEKLKKRELGAPKIERPYKCDICNISLETPKMLQLHLDGRPHAKVLKKLETEFKDTKCEVCQIDFNSFKQYHMHINGQKHMKKLRQNALRTPVLVKDQKESITCKNCPYIGELDNHVCDRSLENVAVTKEDPDSKFICKVCYNIQFANKEEFEEHKKSRRHLLCTLNVEGENITEDKVHWYCFTCRKQYHSQKEYCAHLFEHKHMTLSDESCNLGDKTDLWHCSVCAIVMDQVTKEEHMRSRRHLIQAAQQDITKTLTAMANQELGTHTFHCPHCDKKFLSFISYSDHVLDREHLEKIVDAKLTAGT